MKLGKREIYLMDIIVVVGTLIVLLGVIRYAQPLINAPLDNFTTAETIILFELERGTILLVDDTPDFTSPERIPITDKLLISLKPGVYYWKVDGILDSPIRKLIVVSTVDLRLRAAGEKYEVINIGTVSANVTFYENETILTSRVIEAGKSEPAQGTMIVGGQHG